MSASGFARDAAHSVFEALRPSTDQTLDRAAFATYSLDLVAIGAVAAVVVRDRVVAPQPAVVDPNSQQVA